MIKKGPVIKRRDSDKVEGTSDKVEGTIDKVEGASDKVEPVIK